MYVDDLVFEFNSLFKKINVKLAKEIECNVSLRIMLLELEIAPLIAFESNLPNYWSIH